MITLLERKIALRYLFTKKKDGFINIISTFSFLGIALGVAVLIVVMSVMNGFRTELINKIVGFNSHITVKPYEKSFNVKEFESSNLSLISKNIMLSNSAEGIIIREQNSKGILLRGYLEKDFSKLEFINNKNFVGQNKTLVKNFVSIGKELSFTLDLKIGDNITIMSSSGVETQIGRAHV